MSDHIATKKLIEFLRIKSVHPEPDYGNILYIRLPAIFFKVFETRNTYFYNAK